MYVRMQLYKYNKYIYVLYSTVPYKQVIYLLRFFTLEEYLWGA